MKNAFFLTICVAREGAFEEELEISQLVGVVEESTKECKEQSRANTTPRLHVNVCVIELA